MAKQTRKHATREDWLVEALAWVRRHAEAHGYELPAAVRVACGFPSKGGLAAKKRTLGECWASQASEDRHAEIFVSPTLSKPADVLAVLVHEAVHAIVGHKAGHKTPFRRCATALGLEGKMTATTAGAELADRLAALAGDLGPYPHGRLNGLTNGTKTQGTRLIKCECPSCGYTVRTTAKWLDVGNPVCPCGDVMLAPDDESESESD